MSSILANVSEANERIVPENSTQFIALQMALKSGDPYLFRPYLHFIAASSLDHSLEIFRRERKLPINN